VFDGQQPAMIVLFAGVASPAFATAILWAGPTTGITPNSASFWFAVVTSSRCATTTATYEGASEKRAY
jgi:hypothetical protein